MLVFIQHSGTANFYYATGIKLESSYHVVGEKLNVLIVPDMEKERAARESKADEVVSYSEIGYHERRKKMDARTAFVESLKEFLREKGVTRVQIPPDFPAYIALNLNFSVEVVENPFLKKRAIKSKEEVEKIRESCIAAVKAFDFIRREISREKMCEELRYAVELYLFQQGFIAEGTIVASGKLTALPHFRGRGRIEEHVVVDIFPKSREHGYYGDFTRTVLLDCDSEIEEMLKVVIEAKQKGIETVREGITARDVHNAVCDVIESYGYHTLRSKASEGFIHSTGHGVGLEVHEEPRIFENDDVLKAGMVFTIEPGLYYRNVGGVRVEDTVVVGRGGCEVLTPYEDWVKV